MGADCHLDHEWKNSGLILCHKSGDDWKWQERFEGIEGHSPEHDGVGKVHQDIKEEHLGLQEKVRPRLSSKEGWCQCINGHGVFCGGHLMQCGTIGLNCWNYSGMDESRGRGIGYLH